MKMMTSFSKQGRSSTVAADPRTRPQEDDFDDDMGDVHEEIPYQTERLTHTGAWACALPPEWGCTGTRAHRRLRSQMLASEL